MTKKSNRAERPRVAAGAVIDTLSDEFDAMLLRMQTPKARRAMRAAFHASPKQMGKAAVALARSSCRGTFTFPA